MDAITVTAEAVNVASGTPDADVPGATSDEAAMLADRHYLWDALVEIDVFSNTRPFDKLSAELHAHIKGHLRRFKALHTNASDTPLKADCLTLWNILTELEEWSLMAPSSEIAHFAKERTKAARQAFKPTLTTSRRNPFTPD